jgi:5-methyltetrahydropteroyltriglutamate--homocysteine methyltransferase
VEEVRTSLTGPFPRPEAVVTATRDLDRGRVAPEAVAAAYRSAESELVALERKNGLSPLTGGYLRWPDLFRPFAEGWPGFEVGTLTRWFETNTFYRQPVLRTPPERRPGALAAWLPAASPSLSPGEAKVILPGPYTFAGLLDNQSGETALSLIHRLGRLLAEELAELRKLGYASVQFQEPLLVVRPPEGPAAESVRAAYRTIAEAAGPAETVLWTFFGDAAPVFPLLASLPVGAVGIDLAETEPDSLRAPNALIGLGFGCIDPRTTLVEEPRELARIVHRTTERLGAKHVLLGPGAALDLLPWEAAVRKVGMLPAAREALAGNGSTA